ncbi:30S ribosomal protein S3 [bacterium]|nr:30S ribosomal protein S3 [bacterium]
MGNKIHPNGFRVGVYHPSSGTRREWNATWFPSRLGDYSRLIEADHIIRETIAKRHLDAAVQEVVISRQVNNIGPDSVEVSVHTARPGALIGKGGENINKTVRTLKRLLPNQRIAIKAVEIRDGDIYANVVADNIRRQVENRRQVRRIARRAVEAALAGGAHGCRVEVAGRIDGREIARTLKFSEGSVPRHTLRANVDYGFAEARTKYGAIGIKVWIHRELDS